MNSGVLRSSSLHKHPVRYYDKVEFDLTMRFCFNFIVTDSYVVFSSILPRASSMVLPLRVCGVGIYTFARLRSYWRINKREDEALLFSFRL